jgi:hypothetical protein
MAQRDPVAVALHREYRGNCFQLAQHTRHTDIPGMQDGTYTRPAEDRQDTRVKAGHAVWDVRISDDSERDQRNANLPYLRNRP